MKLKKKTMVLLNLFTSCCLFHPKVEAISELPVKTYTIDHIRNREKAKKWAEKKYTSWKKALSETEEYSLERLLQPLQEKEANNLANINHQLKVYGGDLAARAIDTPIANKNLQAHIDRITRAINRKEGRLDKPLIVYKNETLQEVLHTNDNYFRNSDNMLDEAQVKQLKEDFLTGLHSEFRIYDLFEDPNQDKMIKWKIELPAGTQTGLITEDKIVIDKDSGFKVTGIKIIVEKGKQLIRIVAKTMPKETVINKIKQLTDQLQQDFNARLHLPLDKKFLDFKLTGPASYVIAKNLKEVINAFISGIEPAVTRKTLQFMTEKKGYITLTDRKLYTLPIVYEPDERVLDEVIEMMDTAGYFNRINRTLSLYFLEDMKKNARGTPETLFHEFGHGVDNYGAQLLQLKEGELSETFQFTKIFAKEGSNLTEYGSKHPAEFFAEAFWMMHDPEHQIDVKEKAPETYTFIKKALDNILKAKSRASHNQNLSQRNF